MAQPAAAPLSAAGFAARRMGILIALGMLIFALNDVMGKWLVATCAVGQVLLLRSGTALILLAPLVLRAGARLWPLERPGMQVARMVASTLEVTASISRSSRCHWRM